MTLPRSVVKDDSNRVELFSISLFGASILDKAVNEKIFEDYLCSESR